MQRSPLYHYLERLTQGDRSVAPKLCQQLSDRLIYVPTVSPPAGAGKGSLSVKVVRLDEESKERIVIFTTEKLYKAWAATVVDQTQFISLLGGDFCAALSPKSYLLVDPGSPHTIELDPSLIKQIAECPPEDLSTPPPVDNSVPQNPSPVQAPQTAPIPPLLRGRSEPTSFMVRPKMAKLPSFKDEIRPSAQRPALPVPVSSGSSILEQRKSVKKEEFPAYKPVNEPQSDDSEVESTAEVEARGIPVGPDGEGGVQFERPVIFSNDRDSNRVVREKEDPSKKKKRSFLNFLKGS